MIKATREGGLKFVIYPASKPYTRLVNFTLLPKALAYFNDDSGSSDDGLYLHACNAQHGIVDILTHDDHFRQVGFTVLL